MDKPFDYIFIDTSVFQSESYFKKSGAVSRLLDLAEKGWVKVLMPEITQREWLKHFTDATFLKFTDIEKKATLMDNPTDVEDFSKKYSTLTTTYNDIVERSFIRHLKRADVIVIPTSYACDTLEAVVDKYFNKEKPFGSKGKEKEFPDAFVLASLEKYAEEKAIEHIQLFSLDNDMNKYNSSIFIKQEAGSYLNDFITKRIPEHEEEEKRKRDAKDIEKLKDYLEHNFDAFKPQIHSHIEEYLSDTSLYSERFNYADIEDVNITKLELDGNTKNMEIMSVEDNAIKALYYVDVKATVQVNHFDEENSVWDSEDKKYMFESYTDTNLELSSCIKVAFEMDRMELDMEQDPAVEIVEIDSDDLLDSINDGPREYRHKATPSNVANWITGYPMQSTVEAFAKAQAQAKEKLNPIGVAVGSITAMSAALQQMQMPETVKGFQQMSLINPSLVEAIKSFQKVQDSIPKSAISTICDLAAKGGLGSLGLDKK